MPCLLKIPQKSLHAFTRANQFRFVACFNEAEFEKAKETSKQEHKRQLDDLKDILQVKDPPPKKKVPAMQAASTESSIGARNKGQQRGAQGVLQKDHAREGRTFEE